MNRPGLRAVFFMRNMSAASKHEGRPARQYNLRP
jgi:hypothetical protein